ncbi:hypothetical protein ACOSQ4_013969 [Xanthoceras sorbifolium]
MNKFPIQKKQHMYNKIRQQLDKEQQEKNAKISRIKFVCFFLSARSFAATSIFLPSLLRTKFHFLSSAAILNATSRSYNSLLLVSYPRISSDNKFMLSDFAFCFLALDDLCPRGRSSPSD